MINKKSGQFLMSVTVYVCMFLLLLSCGGGGGDDSGGAAGESGAIRLTTSASSLPADGSSSAVITAYITDSSGNPVRHYTEVTFRTNLGHFRNGSTSYTMSTQPPLDAEGFPNPDAPPTGIAEAALIAATQAGTARVTVTSNGVTQSVDIEMTGGLVSGISLSTSQGSVSTDNSDSTTITATVLDANNAALKDTTVSFKATSGTLSVPSVVTDDNGQAAVTFSCGNLDNSNRTSTITATAGSVSRQISIQITGTTLELTTNFQNLEITSSVITSQIDSEKAILTIAAKDAGSNRISNALITASVDPSSTGSVILSPSSGYTDNTGELMIEVFGKSKGTAIVKVEGLGATATQSYSVGLAGEVFSIISPTEDPYSLAKGASVSIVVQAPTQSQVIFATTCGTWDGGTSAVVTRSVTKGQASATLSSTEACNATVQVYDAADANTSDSMKVNIYPPADSAARIDLQANSYVVARSIGGILNSVVLEATVRDDTFQIVPNVAVSFSISDSTGGGEYVSPPLAYTQPGSGKAEATFTSGSVSSGARGVTVTATVVGKATVTDSISIVIGGTAGSVVIGFGTTIESTEDNTSYKLPMSAQVADSNGNPVPGARISLKLWPLQYRTGQWVPLVITELNSNCIPDVFNTYINEDDTFPGTYFYRNLILDPGEDANSDGLMTPPNSASGSVPEEVVADENGVASFEITYSKSNAAWIFAELTGSTTVLGSETRSTYQFILPWSVADAGACLLPNSPYFDIPEPEIPMLITLTATPDEVYPDGGTSTSSIRAQVTQNGNPVADGTAVSFAIISGLGGLGGPTSSEATATTIAGQASVIYYSGDRPGDVTIRAILLDGTSATVDLKLTRGAGEPFTIDLTFLPDELSADGGASQSYVRANVVDSDDFPVYDGTLITFSILSGSGAFGSPFPAGSNEVSRTTTGGIASTTYYSGSITTETEKVLIRAQAENGSFTEKELTLVEVIGSMTLTATPDTIPPDGTSSSTITATILDNTGDPVAKGTAVRFVTSLGTILTPSVTTPDDSGKVTVSLVAGTTAGTAIVTATATVGTSSLTQSVMVKIGGTTGTIVLSAFPTTLPANGTSSSKIKATVTDNAGAPVTQGTMVTFETNKVDTKFEESGGQSVTVPIQNNNGIVYVSLIAGTTPGTAKVDATVTIGTSTVTQSVYVTISPFSIELAADPTSVTCGTTEAKVTATLRDAGGGTIEGKDIAFTVENGGILSAYTVTTDTNGEASVTYTPPGVCIVPGDTAIITATYDTASASIDIPYAP
ncbi:bacterial group 1 Ig-like protein [delta proteobacterium NaphS2]|nr:bacterial group 1 Ig-like protein [delta proteobacterium NaphS2]